MYNLFVLLLCTDINECNAYDGICKYGECTNIIGSYDCVCDVGFAMDEFGYQCVGKFRNHCFLLYQINCATIYV